MLDDHCLETVLSYVRDAPARASCRKWASHIYDALMLERHIRVKKRLAAAGSVSFDYMDSRDLGPELVETISFHFDFRPKGEYTLQFSHQVQGDLADVCVDMIGSWHVDMGDIVCEAVACIPKYGNATSSPPKVQFKLPIELVLVGRADHDEDWRLRWEQSIKSRALVLDLSNESEMIPLDTKELVELNEDAVFVEVGGRMVQVCEDIRENYPEASWAHLMSVRVRVGLV